MSEKENPFMSRRRFFKRLFGGGDRIDATFFGIQVAFDAAGQEELRARIQMAIDGDDPTSVEEKRSYYKRLTHLVTEAEPYFDHGYFEHIVGYEDGEESFEEWANEIQAEMATEEDEVSDEVDGMTRMESSQRYIVVTLLVFFEGKHPYYGTDRDIDDFYTRAGMAELINTINRLNFDKVISDAVFLMPGSPEDGFSWSDFADEGWEHLVELNY